MEESRRLQTEPIDLDTCLLAFTKEEELGEDELYNCSFCKKEVLATKKLDIWRLPPVLVSVCVCVRERERERVCVYKRERESVCVCVMIIMNT